MSHASSVPSSGSTKRPRSWRRGRGVPRFTRLPTIAHGRVLDSVCWLGRFWCKPSEAILAKLDTGASYGRSEVRAILGGLEMKTERVDVYLSSVVPLLAWLAWQRSCHAFKLS
jgi:hypothetical protein